MRDNVDRVLDRDQKLTDLDSRAGKIVFVRLLHVSMICLTLDFSLLHLLFLRFFS